MGTETLKEEINLERGEAKAGRDGRAERHQRRGREGGRKERGRRRRPSGVEAGGTSAQGREVCRQVRTRNHWRRAERLRRHRQHRAPHAGGRGSRGGRGRTREVGRAFGFLQEGHQWGKPGPKEVEPRLLEELGRLPDVETQGRPKEGSPRGIHDGSCLQE